MNKHQSWARAPGNEDLPDLALSMSLQQAQPNPHVADRLSAGLLGQRHFSYYKTTRDARTYVPIEEGRRTLYRGGPTSFKAEVHPKRGVDPGLDTKGQNNDSVARPRCKSPACASCSKWSLECIHVAALNAFDEHDSDSDFDDCHAARLTSQLVRLQNKHARWHGAARCSLTYTAPPTPAPPQTQTSPMLQRWLGHSPYQEGFNGIATARALSAGAMNSHL